MFKYFNNPTRFLFTVKRFMPALNIATILCLTIGLLWGLYFSPPDYQQGDAVRIIYIHVPLAWIALLLYCAMAAASFGSLVWQSPMADIAARSIAPVGAMACTAALITGSLWGRPMWGAWWAWDARVTTMLIQLFLYIGYIALVAAIIDEKRRIKAAAILALIGVINVPIVKFSVDWWASLHQSASIIKLGGPTIDYRMFIPLMINMLGFHLYVLLVIIWRMKADILSQKLKNRFL